MKFKEWFCEFENGEVLNESFRLPFSAYKKIYDYLMLSYDNYFHKEIIPKPKIIDINLKGTNYEFLSYLKPKINIEPTLDQKNFDINATYKGYVYKPKDGVTGMVTMPILINDKWIITIHHEVLHLIQDLIKIHLDKKNPIKMKLQEIIFNQNIKSAKEYEEFRKLHNNKFKDTDLPPAPWRYWNQNAKDYFEKLYFLLPDLPENQKGGIPSPKIVKNIMKRKKIDIYGNKLAKSEEEAQVLPQRIHHNKIPVEYYTNLNTVVENLKKFYAKVIMKDNPDKKTIQKKAQDYTAKRKFFNDQRDEGGWIRTNTNQEPMDGGWMSDLLYDIKKVSKKLYRKYIQTIEKEFIYNNNLYPELLLHSKINKDFRKINLKDIK